MSDDELDGSALRLGGLAALGIGVTLGVGGLGTRLSVVSTQAMTGHEPAPALIAMIAVWWGISFGGAASVELLFMSTRGPAFFHPAFGRGVLAFGAAGAGGGVFFAVVLLATHAAPASLWVWPAIAVALLIPCAAGGAALARAINARRTEP